MHHAMRLSRPRVPSEGFAGVSVERGLLFVAVPGLLVAAPWILSNSGLLTIATTVSINAIVLYGLSLLYGQAGILSIAHAALWGIGAYMGGLMVAHVVFLGTGAGSGEPGVDLTFWAVLPLAGIAGALAAGLLGYPSLRVRGPAFLIVSFAFGQLIVIALTNIEITGRAAGLIVLGDVPGFLGLDFNSLRSFYFLTLAFLLLAIVAVYLIRVSSLGRTARAIRANEPLAKAVGINTDRYKITIFMISGAFAGVSGVLLLYHLRAIEPNLFGVFPSVELILMLLLGGARPLLGPLVGAIVVFFLPEVIPLGPVRSQILFGVLLIAIILMLPRGIVDSVRSAYESGKRAVVRSLSSP